MEMWKMLTQKFKDQSLNEASRPFQRGQEVDDRDSGTESDEENAELQAIEEAMQSQRDQENQPVLLSSDTLGVTPGQFQFHGHQPCPLSLGGGRSASTGPALLSSPSSGATKRPFQLVNQGGVVIPFQPLSHNTGFTQHTYSRESHHYHSHTHHHQHTLHHHHTVTSLYNGGATARSASCSSPLISSDYERCSLDYDEAGSSLDFDDVSAAADSDNHQHHSSEEELATIINCRVKRGSGAGPRAAGAADFVVQQAPEKRKWSQANHCNSCNDDYEDEDSSRSSCCSGSGSASGSTDDEVRDLLGPPKPLNFSSSPPKGVQRLSQKLSSPKLFLANLSPNNVRLCSVVSAAASPRKRHRQMHHHVGAGGDDVTVMQRPCLDFEKMQKTLFRRHIPHGIAKARIVKIRLGLLKGAM